MGCESVLRQLLAHRRAGVRPTRPLAVLGIVMCADTTGHHAIEAKGHDGYCNKVFHLSAPSSSICLGPKAPDKLRFVVLLQYLVRSCCSQNSFDPKPGAAWTAMLVPSTLVSTTMMVRVRVICVLRFFPDCDLPWH